MIELTEMDDQVYYIDGEITDDDFFINTASEHTDPADADLGKEAAVYSVPVSLNQSVLDELAKSSYILESGVIGTFECTRLIQLVSMRIDAKRTEEDGEMVVTDSDCNAANEKMTAWKNGEMEPRVSQIKRQLRTKLNRVIESNNQECLEALFGKLSTDLTESHAIREAKENVGSINKELAELKKRLADAQHTLMEARKSNFAEALSAGKLPVGDLPESAIDTLKSMAGAPNAFAKASLAR